MRSATLRFLDNASPAELLKAIALNHRIGMARNARAVGGNTHRTAGLTWIYTPGETSEVTLPFPHLRSRTAGQQLDALLQECYGIDKLDEVACWSLQDHTTSPDLGVRLLARGFEWGWRPYWMWLDLQNWTAPSPPHDLRTGLVEDRGSIQTSGLPYYSAVTIRQLDTQARQRPQRVWHFGGWLGEQFVGQSVLNLTTGHLGVAGIFSVGVVPEQRGKGIAKAVMAETLRFAADIGCRYAILNATDMGEPLYRSLGFLPLGYGQTWWLHRDVLELGAPSKIDISFVEAIGRGDITTLNTLASPHVPIALNAPLGCGLTPIQLAVKTEQPASVEWLVRQGAILDIVSAWDLGWKARARDLLAAAPDLANLAPGKAGMTPLHEAVLRDDRELAQIALATSPDLTIKDAIFQSTPLGWAQHLGRTELLQILEAEAGWQQTIDL